MSTFTSSNSPSSYSSPLFGNLSSSSSSPYSSSPQSQIDRKGPANNASGSPTRTDNASYGSSFDAISSTYNTIDSYKQSSNAAFDNYKPAYLTTPDVGQSYSPNTLSDKGIKSSGDFGLPAASDGKEPGKFFSDENIPIQDKSNPQKNGNNVLDPENVRYYHLFNMKRVPYKLQHYLYYSEDLNMDFNVNNYNRVDTKMGRPPRLQYYMRFYDMKYDYELNPKGKFYGDMYTLSDQNQNAKIVYSREYKGKYSNQLDYINFKTLVSQEKHK